MRYILVYSVGQALRRHRRRLRQVWPVLWTDCEVIEDAHSGLCSNTGFETMENTHSHLNCTICEAIRMHTAVCAVIQAAKR